MDLVKDAALGVWLRPLLIRIARVRVPDEAVGVGLRFLRSGRLRGPSRWLRGRSGAIGAVRRRPVIRILAANNVSRQCLRG